MGLAPRPGGRVVAPPTHSGGGGNGQWQPLLALRTGGSTEEGGNAAGMAAGSGADSQGAVHASRAHLIAGQQFDRRPLTAPQDPRRGVYERAQPQPPHQKRTPPHMQQQQQPMRKPNAAPHQAHLFFF